MHLLCVYSGASTGPADVWSAHVCTLGEQGPADGDTDKREESFKGLPLQSSGGIPKVRLATCSFYDIR